MFKDFKQSMINKFKMTDIGLMSSYLEIEIKQEKYGIFVNQDKFTSDVLKKIKIKDCAIVNTPVECGVKMSKNDEEEKINSTTFKRLVESLRLFFSR